MGHELVQTDQAWKYISKIGIDPVHPTVMVPVEAEASSTTGFADGVYTNTPVTGYRAWHSLGNLNNGANAGLRYLNANNSLGNSNWNILGRLFLQLGAATYWASKGELGWSIAEPKRACP